MTDPILQKILSLMTSVLLLMQQMLVTVPSTPPVTISDKPFLPETSFVRQAKSGNKLGAFNVSAGGTYRLQSSISSSATSITLSSFKEPVSDIKYTMSYLDTSIIYGTLEPSSQTNKELISATGITQNADGTATLTGVTRGLGFSAPFTSSSTLQKSHAGQSVFILSDAPGVFNKFANKDNNDTISGAWNFSTYAPSGTNATATNQYVTLSQLNSTAIQGAATATANTSGIGLLATGAQAAAGTYTLSSPYLISTLISTSTYVGGDNNKSIITKTNGSLGNTIDPNFIATSSSYTWSASTTFTGAVSFGTATTTLGATTSITASQNTAPLRLNGINYGFPSTQGASSTFLATNGSGALSWVSPVISHYNYSTNTPMSVTGSNVTSSFFTIPSGVMQASSTIIVDAQISKCLAPGGAGANCTIDVVNGAGTSFGSAVVGFTTDVSQDSKYGTFRAIIYNNSSLTSQRGTITSFCNDPLTDRGVNSGCAGGSVSSSIDTSGALTIGIKLTASGGTAAILDRYSILITP